MPEPDLISVDQTVQEFGRSRFLFFGWLKGGKLNRYHSAGDRRTLVDRAEVQRAQGHSSITAD